MQDVLTPKELLERLPKFFTISFASKRNSGKSVYIGQLTRELIKAKRVDIVVVMSGSAGLNDDYTFLPAPLVTVFDEEKLKKIWENQLVTPENKRKHVLIILDDCLATPEAVRNQTVNTLYSLGRHGWVSIIISSQHTTTLLSPLIKGNSDLLIWSKLGRAGLECLWLSATNISKRDFIHISETLGGVNYNFMVLDNYIKSTDPAEFLTVTRASMK